MDLTFGRGEAAYHILVELYASGNVILTDHSYTILSLLRSHKFEENARIAVKQEYPFTHAANLTLDSITTDPEKIKQFIVPAETETEPAAEEPATSAGQQTKGGGKKGGKQGNSQPTPKQKKVEKITLKSVLTKMVPYASFPYADHALRMLGVEDPNKQAEPSDAHVNLLVKAANSLRTMVQEMEDLDDILGYITYSKEEEKAPTTHMIKTDGEDEEDKKEGEIDSL